MKWDAEQIFIVLVAGLIVLLIIGAGFQAIIERLF